MNPSITSPLLFTYVINIDGTWFRWNLLLFLSGILDQYITLSCCLDCTTKIQQYKNYPNFLTWDNPHIQTNLSLYLWVVYRLLHCTCKFTILLNFIKHSLLQPKLLSYYSAERNTIMALIYIAAGLKLVLFKSYNIILRNFCFFVGAFGSCSLQFAAIKIRNV